MLVSLLRLSRRWHRWGAWSVGLFVLLWTATGLLMLMNPPPALGPMGAEGTLEVGDDVITPRRALASLGDERSTVRAMSMRKVRGRLVYDVDIGAGVRRLVDARSAEPIMLDDSAAIRRARERVGTEAAVAGITRVSTRGDRYRGQLPALRVDFDDARRTRAYVAMDGSVVFVDARSRLRGLSAGLHSFVVPGLTDGRHQLRVRLIVVVSVVSLALILTGFALLLPARRRSTSAA